MAQVIIVIVLHTLAIRFILTYLLISSLFILRWSKMGELQLNSYFTHYYAFLIFLFVCLWLWSPISFLGCLHSIVGANNLKRNSRISLGILWQNILVRTIGTKITLQCSLLNLTELKLKSSLKTNFIDSTFQRKRWNQKFWKIRWNL